MEQEALNLHRPSTMHNEATTPPREGVNVAAGYAVRNVVFQSGERFPILVDKGSGLPLFEPTLFIVTELRALNRAASTLLQATRAVMVAHQVLGHLGIDLNDRFEDGKVLELGEIDALARLCRMKKEELDRLIEGNRGIRPTQYKVVSLEKARMSARAVSESHVAAETAAIRLLYIRDYLAWLARRRLLQMGRRHAAYQALSTASQLVVDAISERLPASSGRNEVGQRRGMDPNAIERMLQVVEPDSPKNPWKGAHVRQRNQLIFHWLLLLGIRQGELLVVRLSDINLQANEVLIARRADDPSDPRKYQPNTKTMDRLLSLDDELATMTRNYILGPRKQIKGARRWPHLIVANGTGKPLTMVAINKLFVELRRAVPGLPGDLTPHILRHSWNDRFSELMDAKKVQPEIEEKLRAHQMGWVAGSKTASVYTRRHIEKKANEVSLELQKKLRGKGKNTK